MPSCGMVRHVALLRTDVSEECSASHHHGYKNQRRFLRSMRLLLVTANIVCSSPILVTLMIEAIHSSDTWVLTRATRHDVPEDAILNLKLVFQPKACFGSSRSATVELSGETRASTGDFYQIGFRETEICVVCDGHPLCNRRNEDG
jgi:hypothetical protein